MVSTNDTIAAIATATGRGGVGIVRVSGPQTRAIAEAIGGGCPAPRVARHTLFRDADNKAIDDGLMLFFPGPHSFTGEDVLELQGHGGPVVLDLLLQRCLQLGARTARPGEFSERAFLNDKLDLAQAEAIADLIDAGSAQAARAAIRSLQGVFSDKVHELVEQLIELRLYIEAAIDFPEEEVDFLADKRLLERITSIEQGFSDIQGQAQQGRLLRDGISLVIVGQPNAGKSSLLNALAGQERAIVTDIPGTTRDVLREYLQINGIPLHVIDTAGLRETSDAVEQIGVERAWQAIDEADLVLLVIDDPSGYSDADQSILDRLPQGPQRLLVFNKCDLSGREPVVFKHSHGQAVRISARKPAGLELLHEQLTAMLDMQGDHEGEFIARRRHLAALERARTHVDQARYQLGEMKAGELAAEELRQAQEDLNEITGEFSSDDLLGRIFSSFCIGK
jgi:tRNA modification GTPase